MLCGHTETPENGNLKKGIGSKTNSLKLRSGTQD